MIVVYFPYRRINEQWVNDYYVSINLWCGLLRSLYRKPILLWLLSFNISHFIRHSCNVYLEYKLFFPYYSIPVIAGGELEKIVYIIIGGAYIFIKIKIIFFSLMGLVGHLIEKCVISDISCRLMDGCGKLFNYSCD